MYTGQGGYVDPVTAPFLALGFLMGDLSYPRLFRVSFLQRSHVPFTPASHQQPPPTPPPPTGPLFCAPRHTLGIESTSVSFSSSLGAHTPRLLSPPPATPVIPSVLCQLPCPSPPL